MLVVLMMISMGSLFYQSSVIWYQWVFKVCALEIDAQINTCQVVRTARIMFVRSSESIRPISSVNGLGGISIQNGDSVLMRLR